MKIKKKWFVITPILIAIVLFIGLYLYFAKEDSNSFTASERGWIKANSDKIYDFETVSNYPVFGNDGVFDSFIESFKKDTALDFNVIPYLKESSPSTTSYRFRVLNSSDSLTDNDLLLQDDYYVAVGKSSLRINGVVDFTNKKLGVFTSDSADVSYYLKKASNITYVPFNDIDKMLQSFDKNEVDMIVVPNIMYMDRIVVNTSYVINYVFPELSKKLVLTLDKSNDGMNNIVKKYFLSWKKKNYVDDYNQYLFNYYVAKMNINDKDKTDFLTTTYTYGYIDNSPYEVFGKGELHGIAAEYINRMTRLTNTEIFEFKEYDNLNGLKEAIDKKEVDIYFNNFDYEASGYKATRSTFVEEYVVLGKVSDSYVVSSFESLKGLKVLLLDNGAIYDYFKDNSKANLTGFASIGDILEFDQEALIVVDKEIYNYYRNSKFSSYEVLYEDFITNDYNFVVKSDSNAIFYDLFNYLITTNSYYRYRNAGINALDVSLLEKSTFQEIYIVLLAIILIPLITLMVLYILFKRSKMVKAVKKEERRKYTDMLTSLKNRNYLNFNIKTWNESRKFPKSVIVIDLNNVKYVNDNHGYEAGDALIVGAASILLSTQLENTEIIRTDGNEFLIYLVGYSEQQVSTYSKKLVKELKTLSYGFGAALGYSMIIDEIKTIDDAINEATLNMRRDKEDNR